MLDAETLKLAQILWDYHKLDHELKKADAIIVMGSHDTRAAERGAELFLEGYALLIVCTGGLGKLTEKWMSPEAEIFAEILERKGVPKEKIQR